MGLFLLPFGDLDRQKEGIDGQKLVLNLCPRQDFQKRGYDLSETILSEERVYVVTYGKYNNGSLFYIWLDLSDYVNKEEFLQRLSVAE